MADYDDIAIPAPEAASDTRWLSADIQRRSSHIAGGWPSRAGPEADRLSRAEPLERPDEAHPSQRMLPSAARLREIALLNGIALTPSDDPIEAGQLQAPALRAPYFGPLQVIRRQIPQETYFGAGLWRRIRHTTQQSLAAARSSGAAFWEGVCLLPGDLRSATADAVGGGGAALRRMGGSAIWKRPDQRRLVTGLAALAIAVGASLLIPLDQIWSQWMRAPSWSPSVDAAARRAHIERIKDAALASQPRTAAIAFEAGLTPRHGDDGRFADAIHVVRHPVLALTPTLKPTTRPIPATPVALERLWRDKVAAAAGHPVLALTPTLKPTARPIPATPVALERLWRDKVAAAAVAGPDPDAPAAAPSGTGEMSPISTKPLELPAKTRNEDPDSTGWIFDWVHGDGVQHRLPRARGPRRNLGVRRHR